ncbi:hypothetical protein [Arenibacter echinorum]|uniref:Uncharacterized protein n=1 Tax=Arenibacter echinorum TaxID=440515 RepID=A0A327QR71_9FLAO|nr:hypothetical protein [Arenibacter echinorum]RAJ06182.1 hypothetical protein LV92_04108 [Arenibacter echinorum]
MKSIRLLLALLLVSSVLVGQTKEFSKDYFLQKSKKQKTTAWILLAGGTAMIVGGGALFDNNFYGGSNSGADIGGYIVLAGILANGASIPYFISAGKNKKTAMSITFDYQPIFLSGDLLVAAKANPMLTLKIKL